MVKPNDERVYFYPEKAVREIVACRFAQAKRELEGLVPDSDIHHVGSTAVPGSLTKGDLDIQIRVNVEQYSLAKERLCQVYSVNEGGFVTTDAISFADYSTEPSVGIHLTVIGGSCDIQYKFRDLLLKSASLRKQYDDFKFQFEGGSMEAYRNAKADFIERVLMLEEPDG